MTVAPRYNFPAGSGIVLPGRSLVVVRSGPDGVEAIEEHDGSAHFLPYLQLVTELKLPGVRIDTGRSTHGNRLRHRLGGFETSQALKEEQRAVGQFNHALCLGMIALRDELRREHGKPHLRLGRTKLATQENRKFICQVAQAYFNQRIYTDRPPGGRKKAWIMYGGTTLAHYLNIFDNLQEGEDPLDALTPLDHLRGNRRPRIGYRLLELMTRAWEEIGLDKRKRSVANVRKRLEVLIDEENKVRSRNGLKDLILPSDKTIKAHRNRLLKPTEYLIAVSGETYARNKRGRGSTDIRALMIGEYVEIDECKLSIVTCFREAGIWDKLSEDQKTAAEDLDKEIAARLVLIVIIDVASRMPLAWVLSDQPRAVATLEALRMATRDKIREREMYGCLGEPARGVGIGHIKSDNGTGLRNAAVKQAELGIGAISTDARIYSATDKPYVERLLGTEETGVLQLLHGYTGRKAGHLTDYDAQTAGVLDTGMLYGIISRFMIDVYPSERHYGFGMGGRRPIEVYKEIMETRGSVPPIDPHLRRIHLGWQDEVTLNDEGVRVFSGIWFNSDELQGNRIWLIRPLIH